jgi:hypothetical protein
MVIRIKVSNKKTPRNNGLGGFFAGAERGLGKSSQRVEDGVAGSA